MKNLLSLIVLASLLFTSCKKEEIAEAPPAEEAATDATAVTTTDSLATTAQAPPQQDPAIASGSVMSSPQAAAQSYTKTAAPVATAKGMNPPHGQPGHRCDIAVGAPLNSPPGKKPTPSTTQTTTVTPAMLNQTVTASETPVVTAPGMNPPHGQPGHVCSIAVGAPLPKN